MCKSLYASSPFVRPHGGGASGRKRARCFVSPVALAPRALLLVEKTTRAWLGDATADLNRMLGPDHAVLVDYDAWNGRPEILTAAFAALGLPRDDSAVASAMGKRLDHGPHAGAGGARP